MAIYGSDLLRKLKLKVNAPNSGNLTTLKADDFFSEALINLVSKKYEELAGTKNFDELKYYIKTDQLFTPTITQNPDNTYTNKIYLNVLAPTPNISDYFHLLVCKVQYLQQLPFTIIAASNTTPIIYTIKEQNNLASTDYQVTNPETYFVSGINGNTNANGTVYIKKINPKQFQGFKDVNCQIPLVGNGMMWANSNPIISKLYDRSASEYLSVAKYGQMSYPSFDYPKYEIANNAIQFFPDFAPVKGATIDYMRNDFQQILTADSSIDLLQFYTTKWLQLLVDETALLYGESVKDMTTVSIAQKQIATNP